MSVARFFAVLPLWGLLVPVLAPQQQQQQTEPPAARIQVSVNEVIVPITVTDDRGRFVSNLEAKDFRILDEGRSQRIQFFSHDQKQPIVVGFLIDMSNNTRVHWKNLSGRDPGAGLEPAAGRQALHRLPHHLRQRRPDGG